VSAGRGGRGASLAESGPSAWMLLAGVVLAVAFAQAVLWLN
jgi:hypothetical protein